ncbi:KNL1 protein, partial [Asarcornis scutulata]|nr:KNL1 protein [Asarcornis scutulata]
TGMNTLLHAPIQALVQQTECHDVDNATQRTNRHDTTLIFSDENEMEMTASHTAVIARNLKNNETDKTEKIDITSFLAGLNSNSGKAEMSKEFHFSVDPTNRLCPSFEQKEDATAVKKINFNEFLIRLKSNEKALNPIEGPEKENLFCVSSQVSENMARSSVESDYSHEPLATINVTKIFREQDDGMEVTKCQASDIKNMQTRTLSAIPGSVSSETVFRGDETVFSKCGDMEITGNYTYVIYNESAKGMSNCQNSDRQVKTHTMKVVNNALSTREESERDFLISKTVSSEEDLKNPLSVDGLHSGIEEKLLTNISEQQKRSSKLPSFSEKSVLFPSGENMDLAESCASIFPDQNIHMILPGRKAAPVHDMEITKTHTAVLRGDVWDRGLVPAVSAVPADQTTVFPHKQDDMEITVSHTVAVNNNMEGFENQQ